jgi:hypothetical protein
MPIIDADDLRAVLGVSVSMYSDAYLDQIIASSEQICLPLLTAYQSAVDSYRIVDDVVYFYTIRSNFFVQGQSVIVTGCGDADGTYTVDARTSNTYMFSAGLVAADTLSTIPVIPAGIAVLDGSSAANLMQILMQSKMHCWDYPPIYSRQLLHQDHKLKAWILLKQFIGQAEA